MAVDLSKLSLVLIKAELARKGLDTSGKKPDLVQRLKNAIDEADGEEMDDEEEEAMDVKQEVPANHHTGPKRWLHTLSGPRLATSKFRHLDIVQNMNLRRRNKDLQEATQSHRVRVFPLNTVDLEDPTIALLMQQSTKSIATILPVATQGAETGQLKIILQLNFAKKIDALASLEVLKAFREGLSIHHPSLETNLKQYYEEWRLYHRGSVEHSDNFLTLVPQVLDDIDEAMMWELFSDASEIYMCPKTMANVRFGGRQEDRQQPMYAYVQYANIEALKSNISRLNTLEPTETMRKMCIVPFQMMPEWLAKDVLTSKKSEQLQEVPSKPASRLTKSVGPGTKFGHGSTQERVPRTQFKARSRQNQPPYNMQQRSRSSYQQRHTPNSGPSTSGFMGQPQRLSNVHTPPKSHAIKAFGRMMSDLGADNASLNLLTQILQSEQGGHDSHRAQHQGTAHSVRPLLGMPEPAMNHDQWQREQTATSSNISQSYNQPMGRQQTNAPSTSFQEYPHADFGNSYKQKFADAFEKHGY